MRKLIFLFFTSALLESALAQDKYLVYFGGGGEPKGTTTIFDRSIPNVAAFAKRQNYVSDYYFTTKAHSQSFEQAKASIGEEPKAFTSENWSLKMATLVNDIQSGKIKSGSKFLLVIDTHGDDSSGQFLMSTVNGAVAPTEEIKRLISVAEENGVELGLIATNCTSGNLLKLASPKTCIMTSSRPNQYGYASEAFGFFKNLSTTENLEENFLKTRLENAYSGTPSQPGISTEAGLRTQDLMERVFPFLSMKEVDLIGSTKLCEDDIQLEAIDKQFEKFLNKVLVKSAETDPDVNHLVSSMDRYGKSSSTYNKYFHQIHNPALKCFKTPIPFIQAYGMGMTSPFGAYSFGMSLLPLTQMQAGYVPEPKSCVIGVEQVKVQLLYHREMLALAEKAMDGKKVEEIKQAITSLDKLATDTDLIKSSERMNEKSSKTIENYQNMLNTRPQIVIGERNTYEKLYRKRSEELKNRPNPCAKFSLND
jgi:hypothetical protein